VYFITLPYLVRKIFTFYINDVLLFKCPFPGPKGQMNDQSVTNVIKTAILETGQVKEESASRAFLLKATKRNKWQE